jgi:hypothetical protein
MLVFEIVEVLRVGEVTSEIDESSRGLVDG